jgi:hypothetical protein
MECRADDAVRGMRAQRSDQRKDRQRRLGLSSKRRFCIRPRERGWGVERQSINGIVLHYRVGAIGGQRRLRNMARRGPVGSLLRCLERQPPIMTARIGRARARRGHFTACMDATHPRKFPSRQRGSAVVPMRNLSTSWAHWRPSRIAHTTRDWPRRMSPAANTFAIELA